jgi:hypothetical protein
VISQSHAYVTEVTLELGEFDEAIACANALVAHCHLGLGKLNRRGGNRYKAQEYLANATAMYRDMDMTYWLEQAEAEMRQRG